MEAFSIAAAVVSIVIAAFAIWLSIVFYRMSVNSSNQIQESSKDLSSSVSKLEKLFEHLYSDTFSMMRDTYSDMRKHVWPEFREEPDVTDQIETRANTKVDDIRQELMAQIETVAARAGGTETKVEQLRKELSPLVDDAISRSRHAESEAQEETLRDVMLSRIRASDRKGISAAQLLKFIGRKNMEWTNGDKFFTELRSLWRAKLIKFNARDPANLGPDDFIYYIPIEDQIVEDQ